MHCADGGSYSIRKYLGHRSIKVLPISHVLFVFPLCERKNKQYKRERDRAFVEAAILQGLSVQSKQEATEQFYQLMNDSPEVAAAGLQSMQIQPPCRR